MSGTLRLAFVGDIHTKWAGEDTPWFNASDYDAVFFVGDLGNFRHEEGLRVARQIAGLQKPAAVLPGNHDCFELLPFVAQVTPAKGIARVGVRSMRRKLAELRRALGDVPLAGYSVHPIRAGGRHVDVIAARPFAMEHGHLSFAALLAAEYGVDSLASSERRLCDLIDRSTAPELVILAHNGPAGLGASPRSIFGVDFRAGGGDNGDADLQAAIAHARRRGRIVRAVVAGHMHHGLKTPGVRTWFVERDGVSYANAARVPRIFRAADGKLRHHLSVTFTGEEVQVRQVFVPHDSAPT